MGCGLVLLLFLALIALRVAEMETRAIGRELTPREASHQVGPECYRLLGPENEMVQLLMNRKHRSTPYEEHVEIYEKYFGELIYTSKSKYRKTPITEYFYKTVAEAGCTEDDFIRAFRDNDIHVTWRRDGSRLKFGVGFVFRRGDRYDPIGNFIAVAIFGMNHIWSFAIDENDEWRFRDEPEHIGWGAF